MTKAESAGLSLRTVIYKLVEVVSNKSLSVAFPEEGSPLWRSCQLIGQAMGMHFSTENPASENLEEICCASTVRYRQVALEKGWWRENHGHLLGFRRDSKQPVALIQHLGKGYEMIDPVTKGRVKVDAEALSELLPEAYQFFAPLPEQEIGFGTLLAYAMQGTGRDYLALFLAGLLAVFTAFFFPIANKVLFDQVIPNDNLPLFFQVAAGLLIASVSVAIFTWVQSAFQLRFSGILQQRLQIALWDRLLKLPVSFFRQIASGDLIQRTNILEAFNRLFSASTVRSLLNGFFALSYLFAMFYFSASLAAIGGAVVLFAAILAGCLSFAAIPFKRKFLEVRAENNAFLTEMMKGIEKIRMAYAERRIFAYWASRFEQQERADLSSRHLQTIVAVVNATLQILSILLIFWIAIEQLKENTPLTIGTFLAFNAAFVPFAAALFAFFDHLVSITALVPFWERVKPIFSTPVETRLGKLNHEEISGAIRIETLSFRYGPHSPRILDGLSLEIPAGQSIALVGPSGCGKSTLCRLLLGFEEPEEGMIFYDGKQMDLFDPLKLRGQVGALLQESALFNGSVYENLVCGRQYTKAQLARVLELTAFEADLAALPKGMDTPLIGCTPILSRGQRQRLLLARLLLGEPKILILDGATSSLDALSQRQILQNLKELPMTKLIIASSLSALEHVDRIYLMEKGKIAAPGTFVQFRSVRTGG